VTDDRRVTGFDNLPFTFPIPEGHFQPCWRTAKQAINVLATKFLDLRPNVVNFLSLEDGHEVRQH
jgi:hypothetical protein